MGASRRAISAGLLLAALSLAACDALLGLGQFHDVGGTDAGLGSPVEAGEDATPEATPDATPDASNPQPTAHELWAHWPMPNPDASIGGDSSAPLPNPMSYDAGADGGDPVVYDAVTKLVWYRASLPAPTFDDAWSACRAMTAPGAWRVPTRIELVSLIDFTRSPAIDPVAFPTVAGDVHWTSSAVEGDAGNGYWTVSFATGFTANVGPGTNVLCVSGGTP